MEKTPQDIKKKINQTIGRLNSKWDLRIPHLDRNDIAVAEKADLEQDDELAKKCYVSIRFLCWKSRVEIQDLIEDFEERAKHLQSQWKDNSSRVRGTLTGYRVTKSFLKRDHISEMGGALSETQRYQLLQILAMILDDESKLTRDSDAYQRTSSSSSSQFSTPYVTVPNSPQPSIEPHKVIGGRTSIFASNKREASHERSTNSKRTKTVSKADNQLTLERMWTSPDVLENTADTAKDNQSPLTSFDSIHTTTSGIWSFRSQYSSATSETLDTEINETQYSYDTQVHEALEKSMDNLESGDTFDSRLLGQESPHNTLDSCLFVSQSRQLPEFLPYWLIFELYRVSGLLRLPVGSVYHQVKNLSDELPSFSEFWIAAKQFCCGNTIGAYLSQSNLPDWVYEQNSYHHSSHGIDKSTYLMGKLNLPNSSTADLSSAELFDFQLQPIKLDKSCRFHRYWGADRFMVLDVPYFDFEDQLQVKLCRKLWNSNLYIAGRQWRAFFLEHKKTKSKKRREQDSNRQKLHLFAVDGFDFGTKSCQHRSVSIHEFKNWHLPLHANRNSSHLKLFSRMQLGLSKTVETVVLEESEMIWIPDKLPKNEKGSEIHNGTVMTDGCARMSLPYAHAIWKSLGKSEEPLPSAFQGRISGAKGLWIVEYINSHAEVSNRGYWIEISNSQLKIKPHPKDRKGVDESLRVFEVVKYSQPCVPGHLNIQFINILESRGVPRSAFRDLFEADLKDYLDSLKVAMDDPKDLRGWVQTFYPSHTAVEIPFLGAMPDSREDEVNLLLSSGFHPRQNQYLFELVWQLLKHELDIYAEKLRARVPQSTYAFCVPDPYGILKEGEIQINFSRTWRDPKTGREEDDLENKTLLVARNPACLPSDIQVVRAVCHRELHHLRDVIIFPTNGSIPLASMLSGGDYDGDTVTVIWDPSITKHFEPVPVPHLTKVEDCGIVCKARKICDIVNVDDPTTSELDDLIADCCDFNSTQSKLGRVTNLHERLVYTCSRNLLSKEGLKLASLASYLVDAEKQGYYFSDGAWKKIYKSHKVLEPAYKTGQKPKLCTNIIDYLKFEVVDEMRNAVLTEHEKGRPPGNADDCDLKKPYDDEVMRSEHSLTLKALLDDLKQNLQSIRDEWSRTASFTENTTPQHDFARLVGYFSQKFESVEPLDVDCDIRRDFDREGGGKGTRWSLLRASCFYSRFHSRTVVWKLAGSELCRIKARSHGSTWEMVPDMYAMMKFDTKKMRRLNHDEYEDQDGS